MKLYKYTFGDWEKYGPAEDDTDAYERRVSVDPQFHYVPVVIEEVTIEGYTIDVQPLQIVAYVNLGDGNIIAVEQYIEQLNTMDKKELQDALTRKEIPFHHALGEDKLRELVLQHI
jgi:hypothetical protein